MENIVRCQTGGNMEQKNIKSIQEWLPIQQVQATGTILLKNHTMVKILKISSINFSLKTEFEKESILNSYKILLKTCNFDIQILIQSNKEDLSKHIEKIKKNIIKNKNENLKKLSENYINFIQNLNYQKKSSSKNFYLIISSQSNSENNYLNSIENIEIDLNEKYLKIKECLARCGNDAINIKDKKEITDIIFSFFNMRKYLNN